MTAAIRHHPTDALVLDYATGAASDGAALLMATHLTFCPECRARVALAERIGGALIERLEPVAVDPGAWERILARLDTEERDVPAPPTPVAPRLPAPLRARLGGDLDGLRWRRLVPGLSQVAIGADHGGESVRLVRIAAGTPVPRHGHSGPELVCVLQGGFTDRGASYGPGDVALADETVEHAPVADADGECISLVVKEETPHPERR